MAPKDAQVLIPGMCDYVTLHGRGDSADGMKALRWEVIILNDLNGPSVATEGEEEQGSHIQGDVMWRGHSWPLLALKMEWGHEPMHVGSF